MRSQSEPLGGGAHSVQPLCTRFQFELVLIEKVPVEQLTLMPFGAPVGPSLSTESFPKLVPNDEDRKALTLFRKPLTLFPGNGSNHNPHGI